MRDRPLLLLILFVAFPALGGETRRTGRVFLSSGEVAECICTRAGSVNGATTTLTARFSSGTIVTASAKVDYVRKIGEMTLSDRKTVLEVRDAYGYSGDNLPVPVQVKIGEDVYRVLLKSNTLTNDQKRMQAAVAKLPESFLNAVRQLVPIGLDDECSLTNIVLVEAMFEGALPPNRITTWTTLESAEVEALVRDAVKP